MERTVVSCVIGVVCVCACEAPLPMQGRGTLAQSTWGRRPAHMCGSAHEEGGNNTTARSYVGGMAEQAEFSTSENVTSLDTKEYIYAHINVMIYIELIR